MFTCLEPLLDGELKVMRTRFSNVALVRQSDSSLCLCLADFLAELFNAIPATFILSFRDKEMQDISSALNSTPVSHIHSDHPHGGADRAAAGVSAAPVGPPRHVFGSVVGVLVDDDVGLGAEDLLVEGLQLGNPGLSFSGVEIFHGGFSAKRMQGPNSHIV